MAYDMIFYDAVEDFHPIYSRFLRHFGHLEMTPSVCSRRPPTRKK